MRILVLLLSVLLCAACVVAPVPVIVPVVVGTPAPQPVGTGLLQDRPYVESGPDGATFYEAPGSSGIYGGTAPAQMFPLVGMDSSGEWYQVEFHDVLVWAHTDEVVAHNADDVPVTWPAE